MTSLIRRLVLLTAGLLGVMTLVAPAAQAHPRFVRQFDDCGFFRPAFVIPTSTGNIVVLRDDCGFERRSFEPFRRRFFDDGFDRFDRFNSGPRFTVVFNNFRP
jgi:hypothetical protein